MATVNIKPAFEKITEWLDFIFPPVCIVCDCPTERSGEWVCGSCWDQLEMIETPVTAGLKSSYDLDEVRSVFVYNDAVKTIIHHLKYQRATNLSFPLARYTAVILRDLSDWMSSDYIVPIPLHPVKFRERGYNQSEELGKALSGEIQIPLRTDLLFRKDYTISQTQMDSASARQMNVRNAFFLKKEQELSGKKIILVDDVVTTGSTADACASRLKQSGADKVFLMTLAHPVFNS